MTSLWITVVCFLATVVTSFGNQYRAFWADAWHDGYHSHEQVKQLVSDLREANCNAVFIEVRKRGEAYYNGSPYEPKANLLSNFDPLAEIIKEAHDTNAGPYIEVHAWFVTYLIISKIPDNPNHPYFLHKDWLTQTASGQTSDGLNESFDPGHPQVQEYLFDLAMDIIRRYDIDGFHFDYMRYEGIQWGYNPEAVARFNRLYKRTGKPGTNDRQWSEFRRNQVSDLLRKVFVSTLAEKPNIKISAATVTRLPVPTNAKEWQDSTPYKYLMQDWRGWMEEGILDMNVSMNFFREFIPAHAEAFRKWSDFVKDNAFGRDALVGMANFLNSMEDNEKQMRYALASSTNGNAAAGISFYSYAIDSNQTNSLGVFRKQLTQARSPFAEKAFPLSRLFLRKNSNGIVTGTVIDGTNRCDGAELTLSGPTSKRFRSDASGFFAALNLQPGKYTLIANYERMSVTNSFVLENGRISKQQLSLIK